MLTPRSPVLSLPLSATADAVAKAAPIDVGVGEGSARRLKKSAMPGGRDKASVDG